MTKCPMCGYAEPTNVKLMTNVMNKYETEDGHVSIFNNDAESFKIKDVTWVRSDIVAKHELAMQVAEASAKTKGILQQQAQAQSQGLQAQVQQPQALVGKSVSAPVTLKDTAPVSTPTPTPTPTPKAPAPAIEDKTQP